MIVSSKIPTKLFLDFYPEIFVSSWGFSGSFLGLPVGFLIYDITYKISPEWSQRASREPPGSCKKIEGRNPGNNFVGILDETIIS